MVVMLIIVVGVLPLVSAQVTVGPVTSGQGDVDWRPCGDFPWDNGDVTVDCDYTYVEVKQWHSWSGTPPDDPVLVLRGRCTVTCPVGADMLVGPPYSDYNEWDLDDGAYYCNAGNSTWMGTEPVCLDRYDIFTTRTNESNGIRLLGGTFHGCVELYDDVTKQWGPVKEWSPSMSWADLACRNLGFEAALATEAYVFGWRVRYTTLQQHYHPEYYPSTVPKFVLSPSLPQWEGATLHDAVDRVERGPCPLDDWYCENYVYDPMCLACAGQHDKKDWRPCGDFPWDRDNITVDCDYTYSKVKQRPSWTTTTDPPLVLQGRCVVTSTCPKETDLLVGPPYSDYYFGLGLTDGAYYCNVSSGTWLGSEPVCQDWRPCGDFPWNKDGATVDCDYTYSEIMQKPSTSTTQPPLVLQGRCTVSCPDEAGMLVGPYSDYRGWGPFDGAYYCDVGNNSWMGTEPVCLGRYDLFTSKTNETNGIRLVGGEFYGCVLLYDDVTQQWGPLGGWEPDRYGIHAENSMAWADLACQTLGFNAGLAIQAYTNGDISLLQSHYRQRYYPPTVPKFIMSQSFPQWEGATLHDAIDRVERESCQYGSWHCANENYQYQMCLACAGHQEQDNPRDWRPCGDFPWDNDDVNVDCDYTYSGEGPPWASPTDTPLVLQGRCTVTCRDLWDIQLVGPPYSEELGLSDGTYYCNVGNSTWFGTEPVCLGMFSFYTVITNETNGIRLIGGEFYGCVELFDDVTQQWGPVGGFEIHDGGNHSEDRMSWADLACRDMGFNAGLATFAYTAWTFPPESFPLQDHYGYFMRYLSSIPQFVLTESFPQWEGATLHDAIGKRETCPPDDWFCQDRFEPMCLACAGQRDKKDWRPCGDFPWDTDDVTVDCDYTYSDVRHMPSWNSTNDRPPLVLQGRCRVTCPVDSDMLVGPPYSVHSGEGARWGLIEGAYYCDVGNSTWMGTEPMCLGQFNNSTVVSDGSKTVRMVGGEFYGCVDLFDNVTQQWGPVKGWRPDGTYHVAGSHHDDGAHHDNRMYWADLACRSLGFEAGLATFAYTLTNGITDPYHTEFISLSRQYYDDQPIYSPTALQFVLSQTLPQWEGATLYDAIDHVVPCQDDRNCRSSSLCLACAREDKQDGLQDIGVHVTFTSDYIEAGFPRPRDNSVQVDDVQLAAPPCKAEENSTHIYIRAPLGECGTSREITPTEIIYRNLLTIGTDSSNSGVIWQHVTKVPLECHLPRNKTLSLDFRPQFMSAFRAGVQGKGDFRISMELFRTNGFLQPVTDYPVFVDHHEMLHVQIQVDSSDTSLQVFPLTCVATPSDKPGDKIQNDVIVDGCATLPTLQFYPSPGPERWRFGFQAFAFESGVGMVYLHCDVLLCNATDPNSRCAQGCQTSGGRMRREAESEPDIYRLIQGPIVFSDDQTELQASGTTTDHQYLVTASAILGACAVLTGAMFVVGIVYKARREGRQAGYKE